MTGAFSVRIDVDITGVDDTQTQFNFYIFHHTNKYCTSWGYDPINFLDVECSVCSSLATLKTLTS